MSQLNESSIRTRPQPDCYLCGASGAPLYQGMRDRFFSAAGLWDLKKCSDAACRLVWLDPFPFEEDIPKLYTNYYTHSTPSVGLLPWIRRAIRRTIWRPSLGTICGYQDQLHGKIDRWLGKLLGSFGPFRELVEYFVMRLDASRRGKLLDVGCGSGYFLRQMKELGWDVTGVEPDPIARKSCMQEGLNVLGSTLEGAQLQDNFFDVVTLNHVIEHLPDPLKTLAECKRVLRPGGCVVVLTPNCESLARHRFGRHWANWCPPFHLFLFSPASMHASARQAGLHVETIRAPSRAAWWTWLVSRLLSHNRPVPNLRIGCRPWLLLEAIGFHLWEYLKGRRSLIGEEVLMIATKDTSGDDKRIEKYAGEQSVENRTNSTGYTAMSCS
jgi:2-polyprenyl-3-methyl-5-hydroxy-6-metoxy-1,4-benzoquinol methylase